MGKFKDYQNRLRQKFRFIVLNENTLDTLFSSRVSRMDGILISLGTILVIAALLFVLLFYTPLKVYLPGYLDPKLKQQMVSDAFRLDSLSNELSKHEAYMSVIQIIMAGEQPLDSVINLDTLASQQITLMEASPAELDFRQQYEESERYNLSAFNQKIPTDGLLFYNPVKGTVVSHFNRNEKRFGIDIQTLSQQSVLSVLDGTVIFAAYTSDYNYVVHIQHNNDFVSVYRQMSELLKKAGDQVKAGEALAFVGKSALKSEIPLLHFELWYKGLPLNPEDYIVF
ncbi:MAG: M23 family metallopeptidase [Bacteroidales bacterium]|jgi:lipoprotein NlpD|nr:M23 family metallopeptidase [Bacteroidales bacterium]MDD4640587.1 M23 family metallopeptidase [Bacteroidales bacterium]NLB03454.1 M23 family metallopeptidase [Bacteroidales bacterium]